uniref:Uncharacterized protein MANES_02G071700 n=1 Tax=Rhizophora mucronata TaxID=61149 RepID=A0A2P2N7Y1_RHIMU
MNPVVQSMRVASVETPKFIYNLSDHRTVPMAASVINVHHRESHDQSGGQAGGVPQMNHVVQSMRATSMETAKIIDDLSDDPARLQIYKSQPPPPTLSSQYQTIVSLLQSERIEDSFLAG